LEFLWGFDVWTVDFLIKPFALDTPGAKMHSPSKQPTMFRSFPSTLCLSLLIASASAADLSSRDWKPLLNGTNLDGWHIVIGKSRSDDPNHLVQIEQGMVHMYKDAVEGSAQPSGYIITEKDYSNYRFRVQYKWGTKRFAPRPQARRDAGILYHVVGKDGVWPRSVECQIQENDVGDVFTVYTRLMAYVDPATTNRVANVVANEGVLRTNFSSLPVYLDEKHGGVPIVQGVWDGIRRVIRNPMNEHDGWNTVEVIVQGDEATYVVNGKVNNHVTKLQEIRDGHWVPLTKGKIALQLEYAEVFYRNVEIQESEN
jgi:hypothetical protein